MLDFQTALGRLLQRSMLLIGVSLAVIPAHAEWIVDTGPGGTVPGPALTAFWHPEPGTWILLLCGLAVVGLYARRKVRVARPA